MRNTKLILMLASTLLLILGVIGCSDRESTNPLISSTTGLEEAMILASPTGEIKFQAKVKTMDQTRRMLTFEERPDTCVANENCQFVRLNNAGESPMGFGELKQGDTVIVYGNKYQNGYVYAHKIALCINQQGQYDLAFRDTILAIDYAAGTFTVIGRTELIHVDENTEIWGNIITGPNRYTNENPMACGNTPDTPSRDTILTFLDLKEGDVLEVRANILENGDLIAVMIKVANCQTAICTVFDGVLASVDLDLNQVTFVDLAWLGTIGKGTRLLAADGTTLTLADFAVGDAVHIKGFPFDGDVLKICLLQKI